MFGHSPKTIHGHNCIRLWEAGVVRRFRNQVCEKPYPFHWWFNGVWVSSSRPESGRLMKFYRPSHDHWASIWMLMYLRQLWHVRHTNLTDKAVWVWPIWSDLQGAQAWAKEPCDVCWWTVINRPNTFTLKVCTQNYTLTCILTVIKNWH